MKTMFKIIGTVILAVLIIVMLFVGCIIYNNEYKKELAAEFKSIDSSYTLNVYQIGEPDWPFGSVQGRFVLKKGNNTLSDVKFTQHNDGGGIYIENENVRWKSDCVEILVNGEGQEILYTLKYDGLYIVNNVKE